jgi:hypothetical protein
MPGRPAARILDPVAHPLPEMLMPGLGSPNVMIGYKPAWRGVLAAAAAATQAAKQTRTQRSRPPRRPLLPLPGRRRRKLPRKPPRLRLRPAWRR